MFGLVVTGPPGVGKTTVLTALQNALEDDGIPHAVVEVEDISWSHPPIPDSRAFLHLAAVRELYVAEGYDLILCGATATSSDYLSDLSAALAADEQLVIRLDVDPQVLRERIAKREPPSWSGLPRLLRATDEIAESSRLLRDVDAAFSTQDADPVEIAEEIRSIRPEAFRRLG